MAAKRSLRVATPDDKPVKPKTLAEAVEAGDYLEILKAQRRQMVADVSNMTGPALAALHRQISLCSREIASIEANAEDEERDADEVEDGDFDAASV